MPYKKSYKKPYVRKSSRPGYVSCGKMVWGDAKKALVMAQGLKRLVNVEIKNFDVQITSVAVTTVPTITQLSNIPQGDTTITRDGAQCKILALEFAAQFNLNASGAVTMVRLLLVLDKQTNQTIYLHSDLLEDITVADNILSPINLDNKHRFRILLDRTINLSSAYTSRKIKTVIRLNTIIRFDGSTPSIADLTSNSLSLIVMGNETTNTPVMVMFSRLRYVDN